MGARVWVMGELWGRLWGQLVSLWAGHGAGHSASWCCGDKGPIQAAACATAARGCCRLCGGWLWSGAMLHMQLARPLTPTLVPLSPYGPLCNVGAELDAVGTVPSRNRDGAPG